MKIKALEINVKTHFRSGQIREASHDLSHVFPNAVIREMHITVAL